MSGVRLLAAALGAGLAFPRALELAPLADGHERDTVAEILQFARQTGAPRVGALTALADSMEEAVRRERAIETGSAATRQTARILLALPIATAAGAEMLGFAVVRVLFGTALGVVCLVLGVALNLVALWWMKTIRTSIPRPPTNTGLVLDLAAAVAVSTGLSARHLEHLSVRAQAWNTAAELTAIAHYRDLSRETGVPVSGLLTMEARLVRTASRVEVDTALELLPGRLLGPVGACLFPAFIVTTVIPVVASMVGEFVS